VDAGPLFIRAVDEVASTALQAGEVVSTVPADADFLPFFPGGDARADFVDDAGDFVARGARILNPRHQAIFHHVVAEADAAGLHLDTDLALARRRDLTFLDFEIGPGFWDHGDFHFWHLFLDWSNFAIRALDARRARVVKEKKKGGEWR